jgi:type I restriction enzyme, S subunit
METKEYKLTDVCDFQGGTQPPKEEWISEPREGYVRMLQIRDFTQGKAEFVEYVKDTKKLNKCYTDDILIGRYGASVGKILTGLEGAYNVAMMKTIPNETLILRKYLYYILSGGEFQNFIKKGIGARAAQAGFSKDDLTYFKLYLPSLENQERIVRVISKADDLIKQRRSGIELLEELIKHYFTKIFGDPIKNEKKWDTKVIEELVTKEKYSIKRGPFGGALKKEIFVESGYLVYEQYHALNNDFSFERYYIDEKTFQKLKAFEVKAGDIIISCSGVYLGKLAIIPPNAKKGIINQALLKLTVDDKVIDKIFFVYLFSHKSFRRYFFGETRGSGIPNFPPMEEFKKFKFIFPPLEIQKTFSQLVRTVNHIRNHYNRSLTELENLFGSLSQRSYRGELNIIERIEINGTIKVQPKLSGEVIAIEIINKELEDFHKSIAHSSAPLDIDNTLKQLDAELKLRGEIPFWSEYVKHRLIIGKQKEPFTFEKLWKEVTAFPFESAPNYDDFVETFFGWLSEENAFIKQQYNTSTRQIELVINEIDSA